MRSSAPLVALVTALALTQALPARAADERTFTFTLLDKTYTNLAGDIAPIVQGPLTVRPSSPKNSLTLRENRLRLRPAGDGKFDGRLELDVFGKGWLVADVEAGGLETRFQDELTVPPQTLALEGRVKLERVAGGYRATAVETPRAVEVVLESKLVRGLLAWCDTASAVPFAGVRCDGLERSLTHVALPLPGPGATYFLGDTDLTEAERRELESLLGSGR